MHQQPTTVFKLVLKGFELLPHLPLYALSFPPSPPPLHPHPASSPPTPAYYVSTMLKSPPLLLDHHGPHIPHTPILQPSRTRVLHARGGRAVELTKPGVVGEAGSRSRGSGGPGGANGCVLAGIGTLSRYALPTLAFARCQAGATRRRRHPLRARSRFVHTGCPLPARARSQHGSPPPTGRLRLSSRQPRVRSRAFGY